MIVPVVKAFLAQHPDCQIVMVSRRQFAPLFEGISGLEFHGVNLDHYKGPKGLLSLFSLLESQFKPDFIADLHDVIRTKTITTLFSFKGYKTSVLDKGKEEKKELIRLWDKKFRPLKPTTERYADVFRALGFDFSLSHTLESKVLSRQGIGLAPFAQHRGKMLPLEKTFELARRLSTRDRVYLFGAKGLEQQQLEEWESLIPGCTSLAGKLTLKEELGRISGLKVMISMDSANMHLASLVGTRCISIWGSTHHYAGFLGYGQSESDVLEIKELTCRPCSVFGDKPCFREDYACLEEISVESIVAHLDRTL